jgi:HEAT repeat protein
VLTALLDHDEVLDPLYLYRLSDLTQDNLSDLKRIWGDIHVERRRALIEDLEQLTDTNNLLSFESVFRFALEDDDEQVRFYTTRAIEVFDTDDLIPHFLTVLDKEKSIDVRAVTASILGKYVYRGELDKIAGKTKKSIEDKLLKILDSDDPEEIKRRALEAVSYSSREEVHDFIIKAYQSDLEDWIASAVFAMGRSLDTEYGEMVFNRLDHTSPKVRLEAVRACGELMLEDAVPVIIDLLEDLPAIREVAIWALSQIGGEDAGPALRNLLEDEITDEEADLINQALERLDFLEDGLDLTMFDMSYDEDEIILDDYDYQQDGYDDDRYDDDIDLDSFDLDDDYWME